MGPKAISRWMAVLLLAVPIHAAMAEALAQAVVYKSPTCGCCASWVEHMRANGFTVDVVEGDMEVVKQRFGVPAGLASCHTAVVGGYVVEGHVPATAVKRLLREKPDALGVSAPGMPIGSPGMAGPNPEPFSVQIFEEHGHARVYESYRPPHRW